MLSYLLDEGLAWTSLLTGIIIWRKLPLAYHIIVILTAISCSVSIVAYNLRIQNLSNMLIYNFYVIIEAFMLSMAGRLIILNKHIRTIIFPVILSFSFPAVYFFIKIQGTTFSDIIYLTGSIIISLEYLIILLEPAKEEKPLFQNPNFYLALGTVLYFSGNIPIFGFYKYFTEENQELGRKLFEYIVPHLANLRYLLLLISLLLFFKQTGPTREKMISA